jgi:hypothetical protein
MLVFLTGDSDGIQTERCKEALHCASFNEVDANAARAKLEATGVPEDPDVEKMLSTTDEKLRDKSRIHVTPNEKEHRK